MYDWCFMVILPSWVAKRDSAHIWKTHGSHFSLEGAQVPSMQMSQMAGPAAGYQWNPGVGNLVTEPVELSWKRPVFRGWKLQTSWYFIPPNKKGYLGALGDLQMGPTLFREKKHLQPEIVTLHSNVKIAVAYLPTFIQFPDVYRFDY